MSNPFTTKDPLFDIINKVVLGEKKLTDDELKKREEIVLAIKRENPDMEKSRAYAIATAQAKKVAEEVNLDEQLENFWEAYTTMFNEAEDQQQNLLLRAMAKDPTDLMKMKRAIKMGDKALTNPALRQEILAMLDKMMHLTTGDPSLLQRTKMGFQKAKKLKMPEEVQLEAIGAKDKQDEGEYGYEGDMAMSQLRTIIRNSEEMMKVLKKDTDLPEWVQSKITLATDYLQTANDYLMSELEEGFEDEKLVAQKVTKTRGAADYFSNLAASGEKGIARTHRRLLDKDVHTTAAKTSKAADKAHSDVKKTAVANFVASRKGDGKVRTEEVEKSPIDGARPIKSKESAAVRVKKIADGMRKLYTPKKDNK